MSVKLREKSGTDGRISLYLDIYRKGKRSYEFLNIYLSGNKRPTPEDKENRRVAEAIRSEREFDQIVRNTSVPNPKKKKGDFVAWFENHPKKAEIIILNTTLINLKQFTDGRPVSFEEITQDWIISFQEWLLKKGTISPNSASGYIMALSSMLTRAVEDKIIPINPYLQLPRKKRIKRSQAHRQFLTMEDLELLAKAETTIPLEVKHGFLLSCFTGLRWSDLSVLKWNCFIKIKTEKGTRLALDYKMVKTSTREILPLSDMAVKILDERKKILKEAGDSGELVFPFLGDETRISNTRVTRTNKDLKKWAKEAGLAKNLHFHMGRHTFATLGLTFGIDLYTVSKLLGHKDIKTTTIYAKIIDKVKNEAVTKLPSIDF